MGFSMRPSPTDLPLMVSAPLPPLWGTAAVVRNLLILSRQTDTLEVELQVTRHLVKIPLGPPPTLTDSTEHRTAGRPAARRAAGVPLRALARRGGPASSEIRRAGLHVLDDGLGAQTLHDDVPALVNYPVHMAGQPLRPFNRTRGNNG